jgi:hypothetical protein
VRPVDKNYAVLCNLFQYMQNNKIATRNVRNGDEKIVASKENFHSTFEKKRSFLPDTM